MKVDKTLEAFLMVNGLQSKIEQEEHPDCWDWDKDCEGQHLIDSLHVWKKGKPQIGWSFAEGCSTEFIIEKLKDRALTFKEN